LALAINDFDGTHPILLNFNMYRRHRIIVVVVDDVDVDDVDD
jgi:hypothetical protein